MINKRQYNILSFYLTRTLFLGGGFTLLIKLGRNDFLMASLGGMILGYFLLYLLFKKGNISKVMCSICAIATLVMSTLSNTILTSDYLLFTTPTLLIVIVFFITLIYASSKDTKVVGRVAEVFIFVSIVTIAMALLSLFSLGNIDRMLPLFTTDILDIIKGILVFAGSSVLPNILLINYKDDLKFRDIHLGYIIGSILMILVLYFIITIYGSNYSSMVRFPEFFILKKINIMGYLNNVENILITEWLFNMLLSSWLCVKVLRNNLDRKVFYIFIILFILGSEFLLNRNYVNVLYVKQYFYYIAFSLVILSLVVKKRKN